MNTVCFACGAEFHVLVAYILSATVYRNQKKILLVYKYHRTFDLLSRMGQIGIWDEVIEVNPNQPKESENSLQHILNEISVLHVFSWGFPEFNDLFSRCSEKGTKIVFTDEGIAAYLPYLRYAAWEKEQKTNPLFAKGFDLTKIKEIWLFEPVLYDDQVIVPIKKISIDDFYVACQEDKTIVEEYKILFNFPSSFHFDYDIIYFRQYFSYSNVISSEADAFVDHCIIETIKNHKSFVKDHLAFRNNQYDLDIKQNRSLNVPWEALLILSKISNEQNLVRLPKIYISPTSSAMFKTNNLGVSGTFIFTHKLISRLTDFSDKTIDGFIERNRVLYPNSKFFVPDTWEKFLTIIRESFLEVGITPVDPLPDCAQLENNWLRDQYVSLWKQGIADREKAILELDQVKNSYQRNIEELRKQGIADQEKAALDLDQLKISLLNNIEELKLEKRNIHRQFIQTDQALYSANWRLRDLTQQVNDLRTNVSQKEQTINDLNGTLNAIFASSAWKLIQILWNIRVFVAPHQSFREKFLKKIYRTIKPVPQSVIEAAAQREVVQVDPYEKWISLNEPNLDELARQAASMKDFAFQPLISIVTPVYNPPVKVLEETIKSVLSQSYTNWEWCIANGCKENAEVAGLLDSYSQQDPRIKLIHLDQNLGIALNTNAAINLSSGDFVAFLDHDDTLAPYALYETVSAINQYPETDIAYSDEDKITADGSKRYEPYFKPAFSVDLFRSNNYLAHFLVVRKSLGDKVGWIREGFEGSQDFDFILRAHEEAANVVHIPKVLYHWRALATSTASGANAKDYATPAGVKAVQEHLTRKGIPAEAIPGPYPTTYQIRYVQTDTPLVSILIPNHDNVEDLKCCIESIQVLSTYRNFEIVIIENNSTDPAVFALYEDYRKTDNVRVVEFNHSPFNYSKTNNFAVQHARGEVIVFLNNDVQVISTDWLERMLEHTLRSEVGIVGAKLYYPDDTIQHSGVVLGLGGIAGHTHKNLPRTSPGLFGRLGLVQNYSAVTAACIMMRKSVFTLVDGFDDRFALAFNDVDLCMKVRSKGYLIVWTPYAELYHHESKTRGYEDTVEKQRRFLKEIDQFKALWGTEIEEGDIYYNPNLSLDLDKNFSPITEKISQRQRVRCITINHRW